MPVSFSHLSNNFSPQKKSFVKKWISFIIRKEKKSEGKIIFIFCTDDELLKLNKQFLNHDTFTDIITFDYGVDKKIAGEIYVSVDRVEENAKKFEIDFEIELRRVLIHGVLHLCGHGDKSISQKKVMRKKEEEALKIFMKQ